jgi:hypothetical protein
MSALALTATIAAYTSLGTLAWSGLGHARNPQVLMRILDRQGWRSSTRRLLGASVLALELTIGVAGLAAALVGFHAGTVSLATSAAILYTVYARYSTALVRQGDAVPCGCSGAADHPVNVWVVARALILLAGSTVAAAASPEVLPLWPLNATVTLALLSSTTLGVILWQLPAALHDPRPSPLVQRGV